MKNQYVGYIEDYGKLGLLHAFEEMGIRVGINWYLTPDEGERDEKRMECVFRIEEEYKGIRTTFHPTREELEECDRSLSFDFWSTLQRSHVTVKDVEKSWIFRRALYYSEPLDFSGFSREASEREQRRRDWFAGSMEALSGAELIYLDADRGLAEREDASAEDADQYALPREVEQYFLAGKNVIYCCFRGQMDWDEWMAAKSVMALRLPQAKPAVLTTVLGGQRSYILLIHEEDFLFYRAIIDDFLGHWYGVFAEEYTLAGNVAEAVVGEPIILTTSDGVELALAKQANGHLQISRNGRPDTSRTISPDFIARIAGL